MMWLRRWILRRSGFADYWELIGLTYTNPAPAAGGLLRTSLTIENKAPYEFRVANLHLVVQEQGCAHDVAFLATGDVGSIPASTGVTHGTVRVEVMFHLACPPRLQPPAWKIEVARAEIDGPLGRRRFTPSTQGFRVAHP